MEIDSSNNIPSVLEEGKYGKVHSFDLQVGMAVCEENGLKIGTVTEIAGFGSQQVAQASSRGPDEHVTQAQNSTGYFVVDCRESLDRRGVPSLCVPFHGIKAVDPNRGVVLISTITAELRTQAETAATLSALSTETPDRPWYSWRPGRKP